MWSTLCHPGISVLLSILATAYLAHYNAPLFYEQLAPDETGKKDKRFFIVSVTGFCISGLIFCLVLGGGFLTFGQSSMGLILNNYAATDGLAVLARAAIVLSLVTAYPLVFLSLRKQVVEVLGSKGSKLAEEKSRRVTVWEAHQLEATKPGHRSCACRRQLGYLSSVCCPCPHDPGSSTSQFGPTSKGIWWVDCASNANFLAAVGHRVGCDRQRAQPQVTSL
ncbi:unnamed protein product [Durusdinium trenchii]|uniref:Amino acid transporter transmembrane domain-containing protein n=1 Tax=Durusdinium trenchii TaxID=1381693 RepID=A0ABP0SWE4_9DINO